MKRIAAIVHEGKPHAADAADEFVAAEKFILDYVQAPGEKTIAELNAARKEFSAAVERLQHRIRGR